MRITCPNCGAQYEVPDQVIPPEGRDVQCSNCGNTWFQAHPDQNVVEDDDHDLISEPEAEIDAEPEDDPVEDDHDDYLDDDDLEGEDVPEAPARPRELDPEVADILREETEHETRLRQAEAASGLESQAELGLDAGGNDEAARRAREARERMARMRGEDLEPDQETEADLSPRPRSRLLPDVDDINTSIQNDQPPPAIQAGGDMALADPAPQRSGGFSRGFGLVMLLGVLLVLLYANADRVTGAVPSLSGPVEAYVAQVDKLRVWLDSRLTGFIPQ